MKYPFIKEKDNKAIFTGSYMECYLPMSFVSKGITYIVGDIVNAIGLFNLRATMKDSEKIEDQKLLTFNVPSMVTMKPTSTERRMLSLVPGQEPEQYLVLQFYNGDEILTTLDVVATVDNTDIFMMRILTQGKLPSTIKYNDGFKLYLQNLEINKINLDTPAPILSIIYSEIYRYKDDVALPLRQVLGKGQCGELDYVTADMRTISSLSSTFSALTFEDIDSMIIRSVNRKRYKSKNAYTPLEQIIK